MSTFKAVQYNENSSDFSKIEIVSVAKPTAVKSGFVLVKIYSSAINPVDVKVYQGYLKEVWAMPLPFTLGYDFSGVVEEVGEGVTSFSNGDNVFAVNWGQGKHNTDNADLPVGGAFAEYISVPASVLSHKPENVTHQTAAAVALVGSTALDALNAAKVTEGSKVLVLGASTAVGAIAIQLAKLRGAFVAATTSTRSLDFSKQWGADQLINYNEIKWWEASETGLPDFDFIFDTAGEALGWEHAQTAGLVKTGGVFISIVNHTVGFNPVGHAPAFSYASFLCLNNNPVTQDTLASLISEGKLTVPIDSVFPFTSQGVQDIIAKIESGKSLGKNVLQIVE